MFDELNVRGAEVVPLRVVCGGIGRTGGQNRRGAARRG